MPHRCPHIESSAVSAKSSLPGALHIKISKRSSMQIATWRYSHFFQPCSHPPNRHPAPPHGRIVVFPSYSAVTTIMFGPRGAASAHHEGSAMDPALTGSTVGDGFPMRRVRCI